MEDHLYKFLNQTNFNLQGTETDKGPWNIVKNYKFAAFIYDDVSKSPNIKTKILQI